VLSPEKLHSLIGTAVYFSALLLIYLMAGQLIGRRMISAKEKTDSMFLKKLTAPVFWYFFVLLGIPFLNRAYQNNLAGFLEYAGLVAFVSLSIVLILCIMVIIRNKFRRSY